jgi:hypothetical protein
MTSDRIAVAAYQRYSVVIESPIESSIDIKDTNFGFLAKKWVQEY